MAAPKRISRLALASVILGACGLLVQGCVFLLGMGDPLWLMASSVFFGLPALFLGYWAQRAIEEEPWYLKGRRLAGAGILVGFLATVAWFVMLVAMFPRCHGPNDSRRSACVNNLRLIDYAKQQFVAAHTNAADSCTPTWVDLAPYFKRKGVDTPVCREGGTYTINAITSNPTCSKCGPPYNHVLLNDIH